MNLSELRSLVGTIVDYDPDVQAYRDEVNRVLNQIYMEFFTDKPWKFAQKTAVVTARPDATTAIGVANMATAAVTATGFFENWMEGQTIEFSGGTYTGGTALSGEYIIKRVVSANEIAIHGLVTGTGFGITFTVKNRYIDMPQDCVEAMSVGVRLPTSQETGNFANLSKHLDEELDLGLDQTGRPTDWVLYDDFHMMQPVTGVTLTDAGAGALPAGLSYVRYTFADQNRESSASPVASITIGASRQIDVAALQNTAANSGRRKRVYLRTPESKAFYRVPADVDETTTTKAALALNAEYLSGGSRLPEHGGNYLRLRLFPRQDAEITVNLRYLYRPLQLIEDSDVPDFPVPHHRYLAYRTCQELFVKHNNAANAEVYRRKADAELLKMQNRQLSERNSHWVKAHFRHSPIWTASEPKLTHTN